MADRPPKVMVQDVLGPPQCVVFHPFSQQRPPTALEAMVYRLPGAPTVEQLRNLRKWPLPPPEPHSEP